MHVKGVAFLAREALVTAERGPEAWKAFLETLKRAQPFYEQPIFPVTRIPVEVFLPALELITSRFYDGDPETYWKFGVSAAKNAMQNGQLKGLFGKGDDRKFLAFAPNIYKSYFDGGALTMHTPTPQQVDLKISGTPHHPYFEGSVIGFARGGLEVLEAKDPIPTRVKGFGIGDDEIVYRFNV